MEAKSRAKRAVPPNDTRLQEQPARKALSTRLTDIEKVRKITKFIRATEKDFRQKFSWLRHQNVIGMSIFLASIAGMIGASWLYIAGFSPAWVTIVVNAIFASFLHEIEHDSIHSLYFKDRWQEKLMMYGVWIFRGNTPNPYYRKKIHLLHHKESGQGADIEEQMIGNGMKFGLARVLTMFDQDIAFVLNAKRIAKTAPELSVREMIRASFPVMNFFYLTLHTGMVVFGHKLLASWLQWPYPQLFSALEPALGLLLVIYILPNFIRQGSIQLISSNMHYFGDIKPGKEGLAQQTQILTPWYLAPSQLFCFNFGSTHGIHHFVVNQPFYLRQMIAFKVLPYMQKYGVRKNDTGTFFRSNRYQIAQHAAA